jgi:EamA domain-containing membrane protein RarD
MLNSFFIQLLAIIFAGASVAVADSLIKKVVISGNFWQAVRNPIMLIVLLLYLFQIFFLFYLFSHNWKLGIVGNLQMVFYSLIVVLVGFIVFGESLSAFQLAGIGLAVAAIIFMGL